MTILNYTECQNAVYHINYARHTCRHFVHVCNVAIGPNLSLEICNLDSIQEPHKTTPVVAPRKGIEWGLSQKLKQGDDVNVTDKVGTNTLLFVTLNGKNKFKNGNGI